MNSLRHLVALQAVEEEHLDGNKVAARLCTRGPHRGRGAVPHLVLQLVSCRLCGIPGRDGKPDISAIPGAHHVAWWLHHPACERLPSP